MKVFFAVPAEAAEDVCDCGIKVSEYKDRVINVSGVEFNCVSTYLNPRDCSKLNDSGVVVLRLNSDDSCSYVAEGAFYEEYKCALRLGADAEFWKQKYDSSVVVASDYKLGMYKKPEYLICRTMFPDSVEKFDIRRSEPVLYNNSEELYIGRAVRYAEENCDDFYELAVTSLMNQMAEKQELRVHTGEKYTVYSDASGEVKFISSNNI